MQAAVGGDVVEGRAESRVVRKSVKSGDKLIKLRQVPLFKGARADAQVQDPDL